jgi:hypothetical protein
MITTIFWGGGVRDQQEEQNGKLFGSKEKGKAKALDA